MKRVVIVLGFFIILIGVILLFDVYESGRVVEEVEKSLSEITPINIIKNPKTITTLFIHN
jgi:hypothetical protein